MRVRGEDDPRPTLPVRMVVPTPWGGLPQGGTVHRPRAESRGPREGAPGARVSRPAGHGRPRAPPGAVAAGPRPSVTRRNPQKRLWRLALFGPRHDVRAAARDERLGPRG